jgi:ornithine carbamoyltransferase
MLGNYLQVSDLSAGDLESLIDLALDLKCRPHAMRTLLEGEVVALYFAKPSTRTRVSFTVAISRLGGVTETLGANDLQLGRGETIEDTARVLSSYVRAFVVRTFSHANVERFAAAATIPVINALTDTHHPCQALADLVTLHESFGALQQLRIAYVGDGNNVAHSLMQAGALVGADVVVATPSGYAPDAAIARAAAQTARRNGGAITVTADPVEAVTGAHAVYTDVWLSMGDADAERAARVEALEPYRVTPALMARARPDAVFMHCLPAHRGDEVAAAVIDGPQSVVFAQAANRLCTAQAVVAALLLNRLTGRPPVERLTVVSADR